MSKKGIAFALVALGAVAACSSAPADLGASIQPAAPSVAASGLRPRISHAARRRTITASDLALSFKNVIAIKFREGSGVSAQGGALALTAKGARAMEMKALHTILAQPSRSVIERMHAHADVDLASYKAKGEARTGEELPDLTLWHRLFVDVANDAQLADVINALNALDVVEIAYAMPLPAAPPSLVGAEADAFIAAQRATPRMAWPESAPTARTEAVVGFVPTPTPPTPSAYVYPTIATLHARPRPRVCWDCLMHQMQGLEKFLTPAPFGIDTSYAWSNYQGAAGDWSAFVDCEYDWNTNHGELPQVHTPPYVHGTPVESGPPGYLPNGDENVPLQDINHGTAVLGELISSQDGAFTVGAVYNAAPFLSTEIAGTYSPSGAVAAALGAHLGYTTILEMQMNAGWDCNHDGKLDGQDYVPAEYDPSVKDVVKTLTANGIVVVAAGGNGNCDLDQAGFGGVFDPQNAAIDSGAIIVGAGTQQTLERASFSSYGARIDAEGEGDWQVATLGYGAYYPGGAQPALTGMNYFATTSFAGTSSATPIVASAAMTLDSILYAYHGQFYDPRELREILRQGGGTPQNTTTVAGHIGERPNLKNQVDARWNRALHQQSGDFDGDGTSDVATWTPATGLWTIDLTKGSSQGIDNFESRQLGQQGDIPTTADFDGDGTAEIAVFRSGSFLGLYLTKKTTFWPVFLGKAGDMPMPLDYDGDHKADFAVFRPALLNDGVNGQLIVLQSSNQQTVTMNLGQVGDEPLAADLDGDGKDDPAFFTSGAANGGTPSFTYLASSLNHSPATITYLGAPGDLQSDDVPLVYRTGIVGGRQRWWFGVFRPSASQFRLGSSQLTPVTVVQTMGYGLAPRMIDTNHDGVDEPAAWDPSTHVFVDIGHDSWIGFITGEVGLEGDVILGK
jgi:hypothetical protein